MHRFVTINKVSEMMGLTSRTLRHWESEGLFKSLRDVSSNRRVYDEDAFLCIQITYTLRKLNIPIKEIKSVIATKSISQLRLVIDNEISLIQQQKADALLIEKQLRQVSLFLQNQVGDNLFSLNEILTKMEELHMKDNTENHIRIITLPPMRVVYNIAIGVSPEDEAMRPVLDWINSSNLLSTARLFGANVKPMPSVPGKPYGYGMYASIPEGVIVPEQLKEMRLPGGLYAMMESSDDIGASWKALINYLSTDSTNRSDRSRFCLEEHIRNNNPIGSGNEYYLNLLEPVKAY